MNRATIKYEPRKTGIGNMTRGALLALLSDLQDRLYLTPDGYDPDKEVNAGGLVADLVALIPCPGQVVVHTIMGGRYSLLASGRMVTASTQILIGTWTLSIAKPYAAANVTWGDSNMTIEEIDE